MSTETKTETKYTPGPWKCPIESLDGRAYMVLSDDNHTIAGVFKGEPGCGLQNARLIAAAPDRHDQVYALTHGWTVERASLYDEECVEGWVWTDPQGLEYSATGDHDDLPPWPAGARAAIAKAEGSKVVMAGQARQCGKTAAMPAEMRFPADDWTALAYRIRIGQIAYNGGQTFYMEPLIVTFETQDGQQVGPTVRPVECCPERILPTDQGGE